MDLFQKFTENSSFPDLEIKTMFNLALVFFSTLYAASILSKYCFYAYFFVRGSMLAKAISYSKIAEFCISPFLFVILIMKYLFAVSTGLTQVFQLFIFYSLIIDILIYATLFFYCPQQRQEIKRILLFEAYIYLIRLCLYEMPLLYNSGLLLALIATFFMMYNLYVFSFQAEEKML